MNRRPNRNTEGAFLFAHIREQQRAEILADTTWIDQAPMGRARVPGEPKRAKTLSDEQFERAIRYVAQGNSPESDELKLMLSHLAGLRACEITSLTMSDVTDAEGNIADTIWIAKQRSKNGRERHVPMHPRIRASLTRFRRRHPGIDYFAFSHRHGVRLRQSTNAATVWFSRIYRELGYAGCSSHSGRRSFITNTARHAARMGYTLRDVQVLVGHARLDTTAAYIEPASSMKALVEAVGFKRRR